MLYYLICLSFLKYRFDGFRSLSMCSQLYIFVSEITRIPTSFSKISYRFHFRWKKYESGGAFSRSFPTVFIPVPEWSESLRDDGKKDKSCNSSCQSALLTIIQEEGYWLAPVPLPAEWFRRNRHLFRTSALIEIMRDWSRRNQSRNTLSYASMCKLSRRERTFSILTGTCPMHSWLPTCAGAPKRKKGKQLLT